MLVKGNSDRIILLEIIGRPDFQNYADSRSWPCVRQNWDAKRLLPAAAAAVGNIDLLKGLDKPEEDILGHCHCSIFNDAFCAAVAMGRREMVAWMLEYIQDCEERQLEEPGYHARILHLDDALSLATWMGQTDIGNMLLDVFTTNQDLSLVREDAKTTPDALKACFRSGNTELFGCISEYSRSLETSRDEKWMQWEPWEFELCHNMNSIPCYALEELVRKGFVNPNEIGPSLPLSLALANKRWDVVYMLLDNGADIEARNESGDSRSALKIVLNSKMGGNPGSQYHSDAISFLIENGADPSLIEETDGVDAWMCQAATEHAGGTTLSSAGWHLFWQSVVGSV